MFPTSTSLHLTLLVLVSAALAAPSNDILTDAPDVVARATTVTITAPTTTTTKVLAGPGELCGGGQGWAGPTDCIPPYLCIRQNPLYHWCR